MHALDKPSSAGAGHSHPHRHFFWVAIMCLCGVDYFSTLGYQPSIAFDAAGLLAPLATLILVVLTLFGALPVYAAVVGQAPNGEGSIGMLERLLRGWSGKFVVLTLLGFAATDFVITKTLSAADAAEHLIHNPFFARMPDVLHNQMGVTMFLLVLLGASFMRGYSDVVSLAVVIVAVYLALNFIVIGSGVHYLYAHPDILDGWLQQVRAGPDHWHLEAPPIALGGDWLSIAIISLLLFPKLALGLSGFETGVLHVHLVKGTDANPADPARRIRNTRKLLVTCAVIMSVLLLGSSLVTANGTLIPPDALQNGKAAKRALAFLAHNEGPIAISPLFGDVFGTIYDVSTIVILWFAGASAMGGLLNMVPQYLPRYGMAPEWARAFRPLVILFTIINLVVTYLFDADVDAQGGAYATGVLVLMSSACVGAFIHTWQTRGTTWRARLARHVLLVVFAVISLIFFYTTVANMVERPDGIKIASCFIVAIIVASIVSRAYRSTELRFMGFEFADQESRFLWDSMKDLDFPVLVPHRPGGRSLKEKEDAIRQEHRLTPEVFVVFIEAELGDPSDFYHAPVMEVKQEEGRFIIRLTRCTSVAHVIAAVLLELTKTGKPSEIHFGWSNEAPLAANVDFLLFGEGNIPWMVRELIIKAEPDPARQPRIIIG